MGDRVRLFVQTHGEFLWRVLRRLGLSHVDAEDASQKVFMIAVQKLSQIAPERERAFLYGTAVRVTANIRRSRRRKNESFEQDLELIQDDRYSPEQKTAQRQAVAILDRLLERMPDDLRRVFILSELEDLSGAEIAALEGIPGGTVASRLRRARELFEAMSLETARDEGDTGS